MSKQLDFFDGSPDNKKPRKSKIGILEARINRLEAEIMRVKTYNKIMVLAVLALVAFILYSCIYDARN